jgi:hypothetical protein
MIHSTVDPIRPSIKDFGAIAGKYGPQPVTTFVGHTAKRLPHGGGSSGGGARGCGPSASSWCRPEFDAQQAQQHQHARATDEREVGDVADKEAVVVDEVHDVAAAELRLAQQPVTEVADGAAERSRRAVALDVPADLDISVTKPSFPTAEYG